MQNLTQSRESYEASVAGLTQDEVAQMYGRAPKQARHEGSFEGDPEPAPWLQWEDVDD